eukprot:10985210-Ditylum_brightwellii.AAC.1
MLTSSPSRWLSSSFRTNCFSSETRRSHLILESLGSTKPPKGLSFSPVTGSNDNVHNIINGVKSKKLCSSWVLLTIQRDST